MYSRIVSEALRSLSASKFQTFIAILGVLVGVTAVVCMFSVGESAKEKSLEGLRALGTDIITGSTQQNVLTRRYLDSEIMKADDVAAMLHDNGFIINAAPRINNFIPVLYSGTLVNSNVVGITHAFDSINKMNILYGRPLTDFDMERNFCVLGFVLAQKFFNKPSGAILGKSINLKRHQFIIVGIYRKTDYATYADNLNESVFIPIRQAELMFETKRITNFKAKVNEGFPSEKAKNMIQNYFIRRFALPVNIETQEMLIRQAEEQSKTSSNALIATASISLVVGGIGIMNLMLVSIRERKREIGIRRACGAERSHITIQFLSEAIILSAVGGGAGVVLGIIISLVIAFIARWKLIIPFSSIYISIAASVFTGMVFGYVPAKRASKMEIIDAMKMD
ncbi:MAG: ABC transporter permease [Nitrospirae bacterium]|nr:ABC transporter permease [Nitrospirota bacterium]